MRTATKETPFGLAYETEDVTPVEVGLSLAEAKLFDPQQNERSLLVNLDFLDEKRYEALQRIFSCQMNTAIYYNRRVKKRSFKPGDLVLKKLLLARKDPSHGKLGPNWVGPYIVKRMIRHGNYEPQIEEGKNLQHSWNTDHLKRYY